MKMFRDISKRLNTVYNIKIYMSQSSKTKKIKF